MKLNEMNKRSVASLSGLALLASVCGTAWVNADSSSGGPMSKLTPDQEHAIDTATHLSTALRTVANEMLPTVVAIENRPKVAWQEGNSGGAQPSNGGIPQDNPLKGTPFEEMFRDFRFQMPPMEDGQNPMPSPRGGIGSGVIIDASGIILTNNHVVTGGGEVTVRTHDGREFVATDVWTDPKTDLAVVKIEAPDDLVAAKLADSDQAAIGDWVLALGQPFGLESTVTAGIISATHRGIGINDRENYLQTDAAINPGNSGGPLVNLRGEVIGINTAIHSRSGGSDGVGFAIPSNLARWVSDQLISHGTVKRAYLGVGIQPITQDLATQLNVKPRSGVAVTEVFSDTPAANAGLQSGDVIVKFGDQAVTSPQSLQLAVEQSSVGSEVPVAIVREGESMTLTYTAQEQPTDFDTKAMKKGTDSAAPTGRYGLEVAPLDSDIAKQLGVKASEGVVITSVASGSPADEAGLEPGMVIAEVNRTKVNSPNDFAKSLEEGQAKSGDGVLLLVRSDRGSRFVVLKSN
jgi:serine protease Do